MRTILRERRTKTIARWVLIALAAVGFDVMVAILGVGFVTSQNNAKDAISAQRASAERASARISEYRAETARLRALNEQLVDEQDAGRRRQLANEVAIAEVRAAQRRLATDSSTTTTTAPRGTTTTTTSPPTTTTTTMPRRCTVQVSGVCL